MTRPKFSTRSIRLIGETQREIALALLRNLPVDEAKPLEVVFQQAKNSRSLQQNALYWKWMDIIRLHIADSTGQLYSAEDLHEWFKTKMLPANPVTVGEEMHLTRRTTTSLSVGAMSAYMTLIDRYCADSLHLFLPSPNTPEER